MKDFFPLNFNEYPKMNIKVRGTLYNINKGSESVDPSVDQSNDSSVDSSVDQLDDLSAEENLDEIIIDENIYSNVIRYLVLPTHRFCGNYRSIILSNDVITKKEIYNQIYDFYNNTELTLNDLKNLNEDDVFDYITELTIEKKENPNLVVHPIDIMGDKKFFEGIYIETDKVGDIQYTLSLGS